MDKARPTLRPNGGPAVPVRRYHALLFIGRFRPLHHGHQKVIDAALDQA